MFLWKNTTSKRKKFYQHAVMHQLQVLSPDWMFSFRIKCVGLEVISGPHQWWAGPAVLKSLDGQWEGLGMIP